MKLIPSMLCSAIALSGCQVVPNPSDTTTASMRFRIHYATPGLNTPKIEVETPKAKPGQIGAISIYANRCVYVNEPFGIVANVSDSDGVRSVRIGPSAFPFDAVRARNAAGDTIAIPAPAEPTQESSTGTIPNPGSKPDSPIVSVEYSTTKAFTDVTLLTVYEFRGSATKAQMRATATNWGASTGVAEVYGFSVEKAQPSHPARQAGMACSVP
ncbi:hypothetical protein GJV26_26315 [Massilia dura]|uniref:Uncharacterized protein n=1 Tax=Pseudoduganella dura TaxID=321982 RepID=A0A6I3XHI2_9BURK|nr:hypothetical protein [Pseudoduganella dura]MUI15947.1 hypothetical protein [Pseudoduganella dura]GGX94760.1 hypothetical protein GCM10007386_27120 [Pseudoduganella dura]